MRVPPDTPTDPRVERTSAAVLDAAWTLLIEEGPDAVGHGQVAAAANVSRTTVYKHFPTRADLLRATIEVMGKPLATELTGDLRTDLRAMLADLLADFADERRTRAIAAMVERAQHDETVAAVRDGVVGEARDQFRTVVRAGIADGALRADLDIDLAFSGLVGTLFFMRFMEGVAVDAELGHRLIDRFLDEQRPR